MDLELIILGEVTQTPKKINVICTHSYAVSRHKTKKKQPTVHNPKQQRPKIELKERYTWVYIGRRKIQYLLTKFGDWGSWERVERER